MGGCTNSTTFKTYSKEFTEKQVKELYEQDLIENGHDAYSGSWGSNNGFLFYDNKYASLQEAENFAESKAYKGEAIICVSYYETPKDDKINAFDDKIKSLKEELKNFVTSCLDERKSKRKTVTCVHCGDNKTLVANVTISQKCPKCNKEHYYLSQTEFKKLNVIKERLSRVESDKKTYSKKLQSKCDIQPLVKKSQDIKSKIDTLKREINLSKSKVKFCTCEKCGSKINMEALRNTYEFKKGQKNDTDCPVCGAYKVLINKSDFEKTKKVNELLKQLETLDKEMSIKSNLRWFIYAFSRC